MPANTISATTSAVVMAIAMCTLAACKRTTAGTAGEGGIGVAASVAARSGSAAGASMSDSAGRADSAAGQVMLKSQRQCAGGTRCASERRRDDEHRRRSDAGVDVGVPADTGHDRSRAFGEPSGCGVAFAAHVTLDSSAASDQSDAAGFDIHAASSAGQGDQSAERIAAGFNAGAPGEAREQRRREQDSSIRSLRTAAKLPRRVIGVGRRPCRAAWRGTLLAIG